MIDTHCHLDFPVFDPDRDAVLARSRQAGVDQWVVPGVHLADFPRMALLAGPGIHLAPGLHPMMTHPADALPRLAEWLDRLHPVALGEIGLDHHASASAWPEQERLFLAQLDLARAHALPVLLHVRKAHQEALRHLRQRQHPPGGIVHAFGGSCEEGMRYLALGFRLGFGGVVTRNRATRLQEVARRLPLDALVLETDAPDLPPEGLEGQRNEPCHLPRVAETLARLRGLSTEAMIATADDNARAVFGWKRNGP